jgi:ribosomal subunit interface protein
MSQFIYTGIGISIVDSMRKYTERHMASVFKKYKVLDDTINIAIGKTTHHHKKGEMYFVEARLQTAGKNIFARTEKRNVYEAIDCLEQEIYRQLEVNKGKRFGLFKKGAQKIKNILKFNTN